MKKTVVVLVVHDDRDERPWWASLGLPDPAYWNVTGSGEFPGHSGEVFVETRVEEEIR